MKSSLRLVTVLLAAPSITGPGAVRAQASPPVVVIGRIDAFATTRDLERGIRNNAYILGELDAIVGLQRGGLALTAGGRSAFEPHDTREEPRADLRAGPAGLSDWSAWLRLSGRTGPLVLSGGAIREWYRRVGADPAVSEVYGMALVDLGSWTPSLSAWQAVSGADGLYLEPSLSRHFRGNPFSGPDFLVSATARAGFQIGRRDPDGGAKVPGPLETGFTHFSLGLSLREGFRLLQSVILVTVVEAEAQIGRDPATKLRRDGTLGHSVRFWIPIQIGLSYPLGRGG